MTENQILKPTTEQCRSNAKVYETNSRIGYAIWYPQMGGYVGSAVAIFDKGWKENKNSSSREGGCIDLLIWHDGEFPFDGESPVEIHHCSPYQFIEFGKKLTQINEQCRTE